MSLARTFRKQIRSVEGKGGAGCGCGVRPMSGGKIASVVCLWHDMSRLPPSVEYSDAKPCGCAEGREPTGLAGIFGVERVVWCGTHFTSRAGMAFSMIANAMQARIQEEAMLRSSSAADSASASASVVASP